MEIQGLFKRNVTEGKTVTLDTMSEPGRNGYVYTLQLRKNGEKLYGWSYASKIPLPIEKLQQFLYEAYDDIDTLDAMKFNRKFSAYFDKLEYLTTLTHIGGYPGSWGEFVKLAVGHFKTYAYSYTLFLDMLVESEGPQQRALWSWECAKQLARIRDVEATDAEIIQATINITLFTLMYEFSGKRNPRDYKKPSVVHAELMNLEAEYMARYLVNKAWTGVLILDINKDIEKEVLKTIYKVWGYEI